MKVNWMIWPAVTFVNILFVPLLYRTLVVNFFSLGWNLFLSMKNEQGKAERGLIEDDKLAKAPINL